MGITSQYLGIIVASVTLIGTVAGWLITYGMLVARVKRIEEDIKALCLKESEKLPDGRDIYVYRTSCDVQEKKVDDQFNQLYNKLNDMQKSLVIMHTQLHSILQCFSIQPKPESKTMAKYES